MEKRASVVLAVTVLHVLVDLTAALRLTNMTAPALQDPRKDMELHCRFDMGGEDLYAVKWYKDDHEFFRYTPPGASRTTKYPVDGVHVNERHSICTSERCDLLLQNLTRPHSSGPYRCEVSSEAPAFRLASQTHNVIVAAVPKEVPRISGLSDSYYLGDRLVANCTSDFGDPKPTLSWYINKEPIPHKYIHNENISHILPYNEHLLLKSVTNQIRYPLDKKLTQNRAKIHLEVICESSTPGISPAVAPPLAASKVVVVLDQNQFVNNQKLHSPLSGGAKLGDGAAVVVFMVVFARC